MKIIRSKTDLRAQTRLWRRAGETIGVVPTMGALHAGHLSLVEAARARADRVIVTLFVNPKQFNSPDDLARYPRTEEDDARKLAPYGVEVLYVPGPDQMYPEGFATSVSVTGVSAGLCGATRPGHFDGVATVVTKLLTQTDADFAYFGEKDYQQLQVVTRLAADLDLGAVIAPMPTIREDDGLALSSRNARLTPEGRRAAPALIAAMRDAAAAINAGEDVAKTLDAAAARLKAAGFESLDYLELRAADDLAPLSSHDRPARLFAAAWIDDVRLIDNIAV